MPKQNTNWNDGFEAGKANKPRETKLTGDDRKMWMSGYNVGKARRAAGDK